MLPSLGSLSLNKTQQTDPILLSAVQIDGFALQYASDEQKGDCDIVLAAVQNNGYALQFASEELKGDRAIV